VKRIYLKGVCDRNLSNPQLHNTFLQIDQTEGNKEEGLRG